MTCARCAAPSAAILDGERLCSAHFQAAIALVGEARHAARKRAVRTPHR